MNTSTLDPTTQPTPEAEPPAPPASTPPPASTDKPTRMGLYALIDNVIFAMSKMGKGPLNELRRLDLDRPNTKGFWQLLSMVNSNEFPITNATMRKWAWIFRSMASTYELHKPGSSTARALSVCVEETRINQVLHAQGRMTLERLMQVVLHQFNSKASDFDWAIMADLYLSEGTSRADAVRRRLARGIYAEFHYARTGTSSEMPAPSSEDAPTSTPAPASSPKPATKEAKPKRGKKNAPSAST